MELKKIVSDLWLERRDIVSDGFDSSLKYLSAILPLKIKQIKTGTKCWTWTVPKKWTVREAWVKDSHGKILIDLKNHPLHIVGNSLPINKTVSREELLKHLHSNPKQPTGIPWIFRYYTRDWGFCIAHEKLAEFTDDSYQVFIDAADEDGSLKVGELTILGESKAIIFLVAHLCHPGQVNDDLTGVAVLLAVAEALQKQASYFTYKILIVPETIGSIAYLSQNEKLISKAKYGIFFEMLGNDNNHVLQLTRQGNTKLDKIATHVMKRADRNFRFGPYGQVVGNDEKVFNGPGINIPMISVSRWPYPEYHTSNDTPDIVTEERLQDSKNLFLEIIDILDKDYTPVRQFTGPVFMSGYEGLWVPKEADRELNHKVTLMMYRFEGEKSVFEIAEELEMDFYVALKYADLFLAHGLIKKGH